MIVVSNTTPLNYLVLIKRIEVLHVLYDQVIVPSAVIDELTAAGTPQSVIDWTQNRPNWIIVKQVAESQFDSRIVRGEAEAIVLANELHADLVLLDDRRARQIAESRGLFVVGTLGVMVEAARRGLIDFRAVLAELRETNFRFSQAVLQSALEQLGDG